MATRFGTFGVDLLNGTTNDDIFQFDAGELSGADVLNGKAGYDQLLLFSNAPYIIGAAELVGVSRIEDISVWNSNTFDVSIALPDHVVAASDLIGSASDPYDFHISTARGNDTIDISDVHAGRNIEVEGGQGDDTFIGGASDAYYHGGFGNDHLQAGLGTEIFVDATSVTGTAAAIDSDIYRTSETVDLPQSLGQSVTFTTAGTASFSTGGIDQITLANGTNNITLNLLVFASQTTVDGGSGNDTVSVVEPTDPNDVGSGIFGLTLSGYGGNDTLTGSSHSDLLYGGGGVDTIHGKEGNDWLTGGPGHDQLYGGVGDDRYLDIGVGDKIHENANGGTDTVETALVSYAMARNVENVVYTGSGATSINGNNTANEIWGGGQADTITGDAGDDIIHGGGASDTIYGGSDDDTLMGEDGGDFLYGGGGNDTFFTGSGNDIVEGGTGGETLGDLVDYSGAAGSILVDMSLSGQVLVNGDTDHLSGIERINGSAFDDIFAAADDSVDFNGGDGFDVLDYSAAAGAVAIYNSLNSGNEKVIGGDSGDNLRYFSEMDGGQGDDTLSVGNNQASVVLDGGQGNDTASYHYLPLGTPPGSNVIDLEDSSLNTGEAFGDTLISIENLLGSEFIDDMFSGTSDDNVLDGGGGGDDILFGREGNDTLIGGDGFDQLFGDDGDDTLIGSGGLQNFFYGGHGADTVDYSSSFAPVDLLMIDMVTFIAGTATLSIFGATTSDYMEDIENVVGSNRDDIITTIRGVNVIAGLDGDDVIEGGGGGDTMDGGEGFDTLSYASSTKSIVADLGANAASSHDAESDVIANFENLTGGSASDTLTGSDGANAIAGGDGNDTMKGGLGADTLIGDDGRDSFVWSGVDQSLAASSDIVADFNQSQNDKIDLSGIDAISGGGDDVFVLTRHHGTDDFSGAAGELRYFTGAGDTHIQVDTDGDAIADMEIVLIGTYTLAGGDFAL